MLDAVTPHENPGAAPDGVDGPAAFDYTERAELFTRDGMVASSEAQADPDRAPVRTVRRNALTYRRFATGAEAIRFAIEELPLRHLGATVLVVNGDRHEGVAIRDLYANADYPLRRRAAARAA